jgi:hypothetical protein
MQETAHVQNQTLRVGQETTVLGHVSVVSITNSYYTCFTYHKHFNNTSIYL